jgi:hypothetical protein
MQSKITSEHLLQLVKEVKDATKLIQLSFPCPEFRRDWLPRHEVMQYLGFGATQMNAIAKRYNLKRSVIGKRIFYSTSQLVEVLNQEAKIV